MNKIYSIIREQEYKKISNLSIDGRILDIGGSKKSGYHELIKGKHSIVTANIDSSFGCDVVFDIQYNFPLDDESFDAVISLNVFEHVFYYNKSLTESFRVLKTGGKFVAAVPFMHQIHGSPDDFFRFTESAIKKLLLDVGFTSYQIEKIGLGIFSLNFQLLGGVLPSIFRVIIKNLCIYIDKFLLMIPKYNKFCERIPLGYFIVAVK